MIRCTGTVFIFVAFILASLATPTTLQAQDLLQYKGALKVGAYEGLASYEYYIDANDTIYSGPFVLQRSNLSALLEHTDITFLFKGNFKDDYPHGDWRFQFGKFKSDSLTEVVDYQYTLNISGIQEEAFGAIAMGKPDGQWNYTINRIKDSEIEETLLNSAITFKNGVPQQSFRVENVDSVLVGRFLRDGLAHDEWTLYSDNEIDALERWYFQNGRLEKIRVGNNGQTKVIPLYADKISKEKIINLDKRYLAVLRLKQRAMDTLGILQGGIPKLLAQNAGYYKKIDTVLSALGKSDFLPKFKVKVPYYPFDALESAQYDSIKIFAKKSIDLSNAFLEDSQLNILKFSDKEALFLYSVIDSISKQYLRPLGTLLQYDQQGIQSFVSRDELMANLWPNGFPSKDIIITDATETENKQRTFTAANAAVFDFSGNTIASVLQVAGYASESLEQIKTVLDPKLAKERREQEFIAVEEQMIAQINALNKLIDSVGNTLPVALVNSLKNIKTVANTNLTAYSNMNEVDSKLDFGKQLIICFTHLEVLEKAILGIPEQRDDVKKAYQDQIWNPFMANLMTEEIKKRLTTAYQKVLLPYLIKESTTNLSCGNAQALASLIADSHRRMLELRDQDTRKLERKLKREQNPQMVLKLLNLQSDIPTD